MLDIYHGLGTVLDNEDTKLQIKDLPKKSLYFSWEITFCKQCARYFGKKAKETKLA